MVFGQRKFRCAGVLTGPRVFAREPESQKAYQPGRPNMGPVFFNTGLGSPNSNHSRSLPRGCQAASGKSSQEPGNPSWRASRFPSGFSPLEGSALPQ